MTSPDIGWNPRQDPLVQQGLFWSDSFAWLPLNALFDKLNKLFVLAVLQCLLEAESLGDSVLAGRLDDPTLKIIVEKPFPS